MPRLRSERATMGGAGGLDGGGVAVADAVFAVEGSLQLAAGAGEGGAEAAGRFRHEVGKEDAGVGTAVGTAGIVVPRNLAFDVLEATDKLIDVIGLVKQVALRGGQLRPHLPRVDPPPEP